MIARRKNSPTSLSKAHDAGTVRGTQTVPTIDGEKPKLIKISCIERAQGEVVAFAVCFSIPRRYLAERITIFVCK